MLSQKEKLYNLLKDGNPHRTDEIVAKVYGGEHLGLARVGARIWDLKRDGYEIKGEKDKQQPTLYYYQMILSGQTRLFEMPEKELTFCDI